MSRLFPIGQWPETWTVRRPDSGPENPPLLLIPLNSFDKDPTSMALGSDKPREIPTMDPKAFCFDDNDSIYTCIMGKETEDGFGLRELWPSSEPDLSGAIDPFWKSEARESGAILVCAYTDIFLASHIGESDDPNSQSILRLFHSSKLGLSRVFALQAE